MLGNPRKSGRSFESPAALKKLRFPFLCTHRFMPRRVLTAIYSTFAGSSQIKGTPVWKGFLGVLWRLLGGPWGPLGILWGVLGLPWGSLGVPWGSFWCPLVSLGGPLGIHWGS